MLENIKTIYFLLKIFSQLNKYRKFKLIKYNKNLQDKLDINLIDYKRLSGKYVEYESNGIAKEYDLNDILQYEGGYLNGKRH